jgi:hypothetical protein
MLRASSWGTVALILVLAGSARAADPYKLQTSTMSVPKEVAAPVAAQIGPQGAQLQDQAGDTVCNVWLCKEVSGGDATLTQAQNGLTYRELKEGSLLGVIQIVKKGFNDYRKQPINPGVYTLRLGFQPEDGDHMGTAPGNNFALLVPAANDKNPAPMADHKAVSDASIKSTGTGHPGVLFLFPGKPSDAPVFEKNKTSEDHWTLNWKVDVLVDKKPFPLGISLTLVGKSSAV